ncbi:MAG: VCBS repeat-containing protein [Verrucomicrobia bacterium]|nr:VCBS repeat-containing protein [Verrucomicrobiota bacterium]MDA1065974.1 VCBS repeat-containing protein [Verrucomicrobiota bacterium]
MPDQKKWFLLLSAALFLSGCQHYVPEVKVTTAPWERHTIDNSSLGADGVRTADVNNDGLPDLITGWEQGDLSRVYLMQRKSGLKPEWIKIDAGPAPSAEDALFVDVDQDGATDVISSTEGNHRKVLIHWAPKNPASYADSTQWETQTLYEDGSQWMFATNMDIDGKHGPDIVIGGKNTDGKLGWLENPADPRDISSWKFHLLSPVGWTMSLLTKDMDGDGDFDILLSDRKGQTNGVRWFENPGQNYQALIRPWTTHWIADHLDDPMFIDTRDLDNDGIEEIAVPYYKDDIGFISIFQTKDHKTWTEFPVTYPQNMGRAKAVAIGDINMDGKIDLVLSTEHADDGKSGIVWLEYQYYWDKPDWIAHDVSGAEGIKFDLNLLLDVDGDGDMDIVNTEENNNAKDGKAGLGLIWYENPINEN